MSLSVRPIREGLICLFLLLVRSGVCRRASKWLPLSPEIQEAIRTDEDREFAQARNVTPTVRAEAINPFAAMVPAIEMEPAQEGGEA